MKRSRFPVLCAGPVGTGTAASPETTIPRRAQITMPLLLPTCDESEKHDRTRALPKAIAFPETVLRRQGATMHAKLQACAGHGRNPKTALPSAPGQPSKDALVRKRPPVHLRQTEAAPGGEDRQDI